MASIVLSFVGQQDPVSDTTRQEGSIVTLLHHLISQQQTIKQVVLLYTEDTQERAELTQGWLMDMPFYLPKQVITLIGVDQALSHDPVNISLAVQAAQQGLKIAITHGGSTDTIDFNASSGTPVMKSAWSILQAAGHAPRSRVWQIRNPQEQRENQERVFQANLQILKMEFDRKVIDKQLQDYNYSGVAISLKASGLKTPILEALVQYGHRRLSLDFRGAKQAITPIKSVIAAQWYTDIELLERQDSISLLKEAYFNAVIELKNQRFSDFLVRVSQFQEKFLQYSVNQHISLSLPTSFEGTKLFWNDLEHQYSDLYQFLNKYVREDYSLKLEGFPNRPVLLTILEYYQDYSLLHRIRKLNSYCDQRNLYLHRFEGISKLDNAPQILKVIRSLLNIIKGNTQTNPFNTLNQFIFTEIDILLQKISNQHK